MEHMNDSIEYQAQGQEGHERLTVLLVDKREMSTVLEKDISRLGHKVVVAECYSEALQKVTEARCDLIVLDMNLPDGDGIEIISKIRELAGDVNVVTMTDTNSRDIEQRAREQRIIYHIVKPLEFNEVRSIIDHLSRKKIVRN